MAQQEAHIYCPHILDTTKHRCGLSESGKGRVTRIEIPFSYVSEGAVIECPVCGNEIAIEGRMMPSSNDDEEFKPDPQPELVP